MRLFFLILLYLIPQISYGNNIHQVRSALWVVRDALTSKSEVDKVINTAIDLNITDLFIQVRALGEVYYNSSIESRAKSVEKNFDPLKYAVIKTQSTALRIHAWVNMFYIWGGNRFPENKNHLIHKFADYVLRDKEFPDYKSLRKQGFEGFFLDPKVPEVRNGLLIILEEIAANYNLAGIHLDYYRYPNLTYSFTPASRTIFMMDKIYDPWLLYNGPPGKYNEVTYKVFIGADREYRASLSEVLSNYLRTISISVKKINSEIELSVAVKPDPVIAKHRYFQDWIGWIEKNYCDFVVPMNYRTDWVEFDSVLKQVLNRKIEKKIMIGISTYNQDVLAVMQRLEVVKSDGFAGYSLFSFNHLRDNRTYLNELRHQILAGR